MPQPSVYSRELVAATKTTMGNDNNVKLIATNDTVYDDCDCKEECNVQSIEILEAYTASMCTITQQIFLRLYFM